jgi:hypothetical protein
MGRWDVFWAPLVDQAVGGAWFAGGLELLKISAR